MVITQALGPWRPDLPELNNPGVIAVENVLPGIGCYEPVQSPRLYCDTTMSSRPLAAIASQDKNGNGHVFAANALGLYKINPTTLQWQDVSRSPAYGTTSTETWRFSEYGSWITATNYSDYPQYYDINTSTAFTNMTSLVRGKHITSVKDFVVLGNTDDSFDGAVPYRLRWSAFGDPTDWNFSLSTMADFQDIPSGGNIQHVIGGEQGTILMQRSIWKMTFIGAPLVWQFDEIYRGKGCATPSSVATVEGQTFFLSDDGFYSIQGDALTGIGDGKINQWFLNSANPAELHRMTCCGDPRKKLVYWMYVSSDAPDGVPDRMIIYNYLTKEWSTVSSPVVTFIFNSLSLPTALESLDEYGSLEAVPASFDSPLFAGGAAMLWAMNDEGRVFTFTGTNMTGTIDTAEQHLSMTLNSMTQDPNGMSDRAIVMGVRPLVYGNGDVFARVGTKTLVEGDSQLTPMQAQDRRNGWCHFRKEGRYFRIRIVMSGAWSKATSLEVDAIPAGYR